MTFPTALLSSSKYPNTLISLFPLVVTKQSYSSLWKDLSLPLFSVLVAQEDKTVPGLACLSRSKDFGSCFKNWLPGEGAGLP